MNDILQEYGRNRQTADQVEGKRDLDVNALLAAQEAERAVSRREQARALHRAFKGLTGAPTRSQRGL